MLALFALLASSCGGGGTAVKTGDAIADPPKDIPASVLHEVSAFSVRWGGAEHGTTEYAIVNRGEANSILLDAEVTTNEADVYVFLLKGDFIGKYARVPEGADPPRGHTLVCMISTDEKPMVLDSGLPSKVIKDLSAVGGGTATQF